MPVRIEERIGMPSPFFPWWTCACFTWRLTAGKRAAARERDHLVVIASPPLAFLSPEAIADLFILWLDDLDEDKHSPQSSAT